MSNGVGKAIEIIKGVKEIIGGGDFTVTSDRISTNKHECDPEQCPWKEKTHKWRAGFSANWPFTGWLASELYFVAAFESTVAMSKTRGFWLAATDG